MSHALATEANEKTARLIWTAFILGFFLIQAIIWSVAITVTASDQSHGVVENYDQKALSWDSVKASQVSSQNLGWTAELSISQTGDSLGFRTLTAKINDSEGLPIRDAKIELSVFHRARIAKRKTLTLMEIEAGVYTSQLHVGQFGKWQFDGTVIVTDDVFLIHETLFVRKGD